MLEALYLVGAYIFGALCGIFVRRTFKKADKVIDEAFEEETLWDQEDETDDSVLYHIHEPGKEGHYYWIPKRPLDVTFTEKGIVKNDEVY